MVTPNANTTAKAHDNHERNASDPSNGKTFESEWVDVGQIQHRAPVPIIRLVGDELIELPDKVKATLHLMDATGVYQQVSYERYRTTTIRLRQARKHLINMIDAFDPETGKQDVVYGDACEYIKETE